MGACCCLAASLALLPTACQRQRDSSTDEHDEIAATQQGASSVPVQGSIIKLNRKFAPLVAESDLNERYRYRLVCAVGKTRAYCLQAKPNRDSPDLVLAYDGDIRDSQAVRDNRDIFLEQTGLRLFAFQPSGVEIDFGGRELCARQASISVVRKPGYAVLFLDQLFGACGSGGHRQMVARKYIVVADGEGKVTRDYSVVTDFRLGYPRHYSGNEWSGGSMSYSHCFDHEVALEHGNLVVEYREQQFEQRLLFATPEEVEPKPDHGFWGERFTYDDFILPGDAQLHETQAREILEVRELLVRE